MVYYRNKLKLINDMYSPFDDGFSVFRPLQLPNPSSSSSSSSASSLTAGVGGVERVERVERVEDKKKRSAWLGGEEIEERTESVEKVVINGNIFSKMEIYRAYNNAREIGNERQRRYNEMIEREVEMEKIIESAVEKGRYDIIEGLVEEKERIVREKERMFIEMMQKTSEVMEIVKIMDLCGW
jgi:hypothetical protein